MPLFVHITSFIWQTWCHYLYILIYRPGAIICTQHFFHIQTWCHYLYIALLSYTDLVPLIVHITSFIYRPGAIKEVVHSTSFIYRPGAIICTQHFFHIQTWCHYLYTALLSYTDLVQHSFIYRPVICTHHFFHIQTWCCIICTQVTSFIYRPGAIICTHHFFHIQTWCHYLYTALLSYTDLAPLIVHSTSFIYRPGAIICTQHFFHIQTWCHYNGTRSVYERSAVYK